MSMIATAVQPSGALTGVLIRPNFVVKNKWVPDELAAKIRGYSPQSELGRIVRECLRYLPAELAGDLLDRIVSCAVIESCLRGVHLKWDPERGRYDRIDHGIIGRKVVTTAGVGFIVDAFQNSVELETMRYHALGTGTNAEAVGDTALQTELTTQYNPDNTRATGSLTEGDGATVFRTIGTNSFDASAALIEHGILSQAAVGGGVLLDRTKFAGAVPVISGDGFQTTYDFTITAGA